MHQAKANIVLTQKAESFRLHCFPATLNPKQPPDTNITLLFYLNSLQAAVTALLMNRIFATEKKRFSRDAWRIGSYPNVFLFQHDKWVLSEDHSCLICRFILLINWMSTFVTDCVENTTLTYCLQFSGIMWQQWKSSLSVNSKSTWQTLMICCRLTKKKKASTVLTPVP